MYKSHAVFQQPSDSAVIWRYRPFKRFKQIIEDSQLYFARADKMEDQYEGTVPEPNFSEEFREQQAKRARENLKKQLEAIDIDQTKDRLEEFYDKEFDREEIERITSEESLEETERLVRERPLESYESSIESHFLNCWHINETESNLMWGTYSDQKGIGIKSTLGQLKSALDAHEEHDVFIGKVRYIDYSQERIPEGNSFLPFLHKRKQFRGERELRAVISSIPTTDEPVEGEPNANKIDWEQQPGGIQVSVNLSDLIEEVYLAPGTPESVVESVGDVLEENGLSRDIVKESAIDQAPPDRAE